MFLESTPPAPRVGLARWAATIAGVTLATACATSPRAADPAPLPDGSRTTREIVQLPGGSSYAYRPDAPTFVAADVRAPALSVWRALPSVYVGLGLVPETSDSATSRIRSTAVRLHGRLKDTWLDKYLDCGRGPLGADAANVYDVVLQVTSDVERVGEDRSVVRTFVSGAAKPNTTSGDPVTCTTRGRLEKQIALLADRQINTR